MSFAGGGAAVTNRWRVSKFLLVVAAEKRLEMLVKYYCIYIRYFYIETSFISFYLYNKFNNFNFYYMYILTKVQRS